MIQNLSKANSIFNQFTSELRNIHVQTDRMRFRRNLERMGEILAYEISKTFAILWNKRGNFVFYYFNASSTLE